MLPPTDVTTDSLRNRGGGAGVSECGSGYNGGGHWPSALKLCLAFATDSRESRSSSNEYSFGRIGSHEQPWQASARRSPEGPQQGLSSQFLQVPLTSPVPRQDICDYLLESMSADGIEASLRSNGNGVLSGVPCLPLRLQEGAVSIASLVALSFLGLLFLDGMSSMLYLQALWKSDLMFGSALWMMLPPLAQPATLVTGAVFLLSDEPWHGRCFVLLELCSVAAPIVITAWMFLIIGVHSWVYDSVLTLIIITIKLTLVPLATLHLSNVELIRDLQIAQNSQADISDSFAGSSGHGRFSDEEDVDTPRHLSRGVSAQGLPTFQERQEQRVVVRTPMAAASPF